MTKSKKTVKQLAEEHWKFLEEREHKAFVDGWIHGAKHEREDKEKRRIENE